MFEPKRPEPKIVAIQKVVDLQELHMLKDRGAEYFNKYLKRSMAHELGSYILENCDVIVLPDYMAAGQVVKMEMTINDRASYENWIPLAKQEGECAGIKHGIKVIMDRIPYGFELDQYYE